MGETMTKLRESTEKKPLTQKEVLAFVESNPDELFDVEKIEIAVKLKKAKEGEKVHTVTLARDGRTIDETNNTTSEGFGIDTRKCINGALDQYAKKPAKVTGGYTIDDGRSFDDLKVGEMVDAHTKGREVRKAFVAKEDLWLAASWGEVQHVGKGGIVTISNGEAIGNNNPCDMVVHTNGGNGGAVLTSYWREIETDIAEKGLDVSKGLKKFLQVIKGEDEKNPYMQARRQLFADLRFTLRQAKAGIVFAVRGMKPELKDSRDSVLVSSPDKPLSQEQARAYMQMNPNSVFEVQKIEIPVKLTKAAESESVHTITLARDGRTIDETTNTASEGFGIDTRLCIDGSLDQYAKKPAKVEGGYTIDDGRSFDDLEVGETVKAHTKGREVRKAFVAPFDLWLDTTWGEVQHVGKGGLVTFSGKEGEEEAIGNNNPCDMVIYGKNGAGRVVLTKPAREVKYDLDKLGLSISKGAAKFLHIAQIEDARNPYISTWKEVGLMMKSGMLSLQTKLKGLFAGKPAETEKAAKKGKAKATKASSRVGKER